MTGGIALYYITYLYNLGHFHNPKYPTGVTRADLSKLSLDDDVVKLAVKSYQEMLAAELQEATFAHYGEGVEAVVDGVIGPATADVLALPRCGFPDYAMPDSPLAANGPLEANWPTACRGKLRMGRNFKALPGATEPKTHGAFWASANNWTWALADVNVAAANVGETNVHVYASLAALFGSTLAESFLATNNCNTKLTQRFNTRTNWGNQAFAAAVITHEQGHALGLPHNNDRSALMYPVINDPTISRRGYPNATDLRGCHAIGYKLSDKQGGPPADKVYVPRPDWDAPTDPTDPTDPPTGGAISLAGTLQILDEKGNVVSEWFPARKVKA